MGLCHGAAVVKLMIFPGSIERWAVAEAYYPRQGIALAFRTLWSAISENFV